MTMWLFWLMKKGDFRGVYMAHGRRMGVESNE